MKYGKAKQAIEVLKKEEDNQLIYTVVNGSDVIGFLVIDSSIKGRSSGGLRMLPDVDEAEIRGLARAMTLKYGYWGLPNGGAKAGVCGNPDESRSERWNRLTEFGKAIAPFLQKRIFTPYTDMGTDNADIRHMIESVGIKVKRRELRGTHSGYYTALSVFAGAKQAMKSLGLNLSGCKVAIEGYGKVGRALAGLLSEADACVVAVSTLRGAILNTGGLDVRRLDQLAEEFGSKVVDIYEEADRISHEELLKLPVDLLCPCARHHSLSTENADAVTARIICAGANNPVTTEAERILYERGILCLPDFVTNSGGVLGGTMEFASVNQAWIKEFIINRLGNNIAWLLEEAKRQGVVPSEIAVPLALKRFDGIRQEAARPSPIKGLFGIVLEGYRRGWIPGYLMDRLSRPYFEKRLL